MGPRPAAAAVRHRVADHRVGVDGGQPAAAVHRRGADPAQGLAVAALARGPRGAPADPLLHQRAVARLPPLLDGEGVRRLQPRGRTAGSPTGPATGSPGVIKSAVLARAARGRAGQDPRHLAGPGAVPGARAALQAPAADPAARCSRSSSSRSSSSGSSGSCPGAASTPTTPTTSRPGSPTSGARTTCVERVKENIVFLENPDAIEEKGGYVPGGMLLWGPPGTGKTLMAEAVAGETGQALRLRRPRRVHQHVHGRRHPQGQVAVPQAAQARRCATAA